MGQTLACKSRGFNIQLQLRSSKTIICGDSATGKTFLFGLLMNAAMDMDNIYFINYDSVKSKANCKVVIKHIKQAYGQIIIMDQADDVQEVDNRIMKAINENLKNTYIIIGRAPKLNYCFTDVAEVSIKNNLITLEYLEPPVLEV